MKRFGALFLSFAMAFSLAALPTSAADATTPDTVQATMVHSESMSEMVKEKAIQAFPEYEEKIRGENLTADMLAQPFSADYDPNEIVVSEMRQLSENEVVYYAERANGVALYALGCFAGKNVTGSSYVNNTNYYTMNAWLNCGNSQDVLMVNGIQTSVSTSGSSITNQGNLSLSTVNSPMVAGRGTSGGLAYIQYSGYFTLQYGTIIDEALGVLEVKADTSVAAY